MIPGWPGEALHTSVLVVLQKTFFSRDLRRISADAVALEAEPDEEEKEDEEEHHRTHHLEPETQEWATMEAHHREPTKELAHPHLQLKAADYSSDSESVPVSTGV